MWLKICPESSKVETEKKESGQIVPLAFPSTRSLKGTFFWMKCHTSALVSSLYRHSFCLSSGHFTESFCLHQHFHLSFIWVLTVFEISLRMFKCWNYENLAFDGLGKIASGSDDVNCTVDMVVNSKDW